MRMFVFSALLLANSLPGLAQDKLPFNLWYTKPATVFEESLPIGNGKLGALIYGGANNDSIYLNDITLWTGKPVDRQEGGEAYKWIPKIREALFREDYKAADSLQLHVQGHNSEYYQPLAIINIKDQNPGQATRYYRQLSLDSAIATLRYSREGVNYTREYFASHPDKVIAIRLTASQKQAINCDISLTSLIPHQVKASSNQLTLTGHAMGEPENSTHFCSILSIRNTDGSITPTDSTLHLQGVSEAIIYFVNETSYNGFDKHPVTEGAPYIEKVADDAWHLVNYTYPELRQRHVNDYKQFFDRTRFILKGARYDTQRNTEQQLLDYTKSRNKTHISRCSISSLADTCSSVAHVLRVFLPTCKACGHQPVCRHGEATIPPTSIWKRTTGLQK